MPKIKGGARKGSPKATLKYIQAEMSPGEGGVWNMMHEFRDIPGLSKEFNDLKSERGTRTFYHEFIAFDPKDKEKCTPEFMSEFSESYINNNYPKQQVVWAVHRSHEGHDIEHVHVHFCISATSLDGKKLHRTNAQMLSRDRYAQEYAKERGMGYMPELDKKRSVGLHRGDRGMRRGNKYMPSESRKDYLKKALKSAIRINHENQKDFKDCLERKDIFISDRGTGVRYGERNYRFSGLGLSKNLYKENEFFSEKTKQRMNKLFEHIKNQRKKEKDKDIGLELSL